MRLTADELVAKLERACEEKEDLERRNDDLVAAFYVLRGEAQQLAQRLNAFAQLIPVSLGDQRPK
ncbi:MAG TPA: hypothetical protein VHK26_00240 [Methyloceanibacter sp.]|jgi:hypothetical protein|nr:hypothetical protein [Methyloceanibacter sp.]